MSQSSRKAGTGTRAQREQSALLLARTLVDRTRAAIAAEPGVPSSQLASVLGMERSALSHLLRTLGQQGWIERRRSDEDQRSVQLYVTPAGNQIQGATAGRMVGVLQHAVEQLDNTRLAEQERSLEGLLKHIVPPAPGMEISAPARRSRHPGRGV